MRAALIQEIGKVSIVDVPKPSPAAGEALVKITTAGVCRSDLHIVMGDWMKLPTPRPIGHEGIGIVEELGPDNKSEIKVGDRVILGLGGTGGYWCGTCEYCLSGETNHCPQSRPIFGIFSEYISVWAPSLVKIPDELSDNEVPLACGGLTAYAAIKKLKNLNISPGSNIAIIGAAGGLGHYAVQIAKAFGYKVIGVDVGPEKLEIVKKLGADHAIDVSEAAKFVTQNLKGVQASIVFAANISAYNLGLSLLKVGGTLIGAGLPAFSEGAISITPFVLIMRNVHITGSKTGTVEDMKDLVQLAVEGKVKTHVGRTANLSEINEVFEEMREGKFVGRAIINNIMK
ncbi:MAG: zinc-dependent alcohol dehydrogenase [Candidatus Lokiarchaeota archaeon]|nr:zinc-dependent alcohol dehydrogenase [Candidatus Lokiarchaeota archaeon]